MVIWVMAKTTLELPAGLMRRVKARAAEQGRSMKSLVTEALEHTLRQGAPANVGWRAVFGRAASGATKEVEQRVKEVRQVNPKDWE